MKNKICCLCTVFLVLGFSISVYAQVRQGNLVGQWGFNNANDETGNWGEIALHGATMEGGQLFVSQSGWAHALDYTGPAITDLTLVSWVSLDDLAKTSGSALTLDKVSADQFCGIIWAEKTDKQWLSGSSHWRRTNDFPNAFTESETGVLHFVAITYKNVNNQYEVTGYRNGESMGSYTKGDLRTWPAGDAEAIWGKRHTTGLGGPGHITGMIEESLIYNVALSADEIMALYNGGLTPVEARGKLATRWGTIKSR